jgi:hypothetical protein
MQHDNKPANERQEAVACCDVEAVHQEDKRRQQCNTGVMQQPAGKQEANWRGGVSGQEAAEQQEDKRLQWCDKRHCGNQPAN